MSEPFPFPICVHTIPVGDGQGIHVAHPSCPCGPIEKEPGIWTHNTPDRLTEIIEDAGMHDPDVKWIVVAQPL